ncbi:MAG TPA: hypothetical protein VJ939_02265, partial [Bacteroidales bacterium]|nr:hypothetical protein [Bacteroidales bacterium]
ITGLSVVAAFVAWRFIDPAHYTISVGFHAVLVIYVIANYFLTRVSFNGRMNDLKRVRDLSIKLDEYREANDIRWMLWAVVAFLAVVSMVVSGDLSFMAYIALSIGLLIKYFPFRDKVRRDLGIRQF